MIITVYIYGLRSSLERAYFRAAIRSIAFTIVKTARSVRSKRALALIDLAYSDVTVTACPAGPPVPRCSSLKYFQQSLEGR